MPPTAKNEVLQIMEVLFRHDIRHMYGLLNKHEFKMAIDIVKIHFSVCVYMDRKRVKVNNDAHKKANIQPS